jgi:hypothetical protein
MNFKEINCTFIATIIYFYFSNTAKPIGLARIGEQHRTRQMYRYILTDRYKIALHRFMVFDTSKHCDIDAS